MLRTFWQLFWYCVKKFFVENFSFETDCKLLFKVLVKTKKFLNASVKSF